ncbi:hypothetical protein CGMCC3_g11270 [Colletotrichum fructicola]|nr:uncharacterized protein CGMCC3_g11270 [Colletotrichum fructicola]KAE9572643.1 hypothetical protein CGMCC3_g11270 [Colletotrichum fructicola]
MGILVWLAYIHAPIASAQELDTFLLLPDATQAYQPEHTQPPFLHEKPTPRPQVTMIDQRQHTLFGRKLCGWTTKSSVTMAYGAVPEVWERRHCSGNAVGHAPRGELFHIWQTPTLSSQKMVHEVVF